MELGILIDGDEDVLREDMLDDHLAHVGHHQVGVDGFVAELEEVGARLAEGRVDLRLLGDQRAQGLQQVGQILFEGLDGLAETFDAGRLIAHKGGEQVVQRGGLCEGRARYLLTVLNQHRRLAILEEDVFLGIALLELGRDLRFEIVVAILALPVAPILPQRILERAIGADGRAGRRLVLQFGDQLQVGIGAVALQQPLEGAPDGAFVARSAVLDDFFDFGVIVLDGLEGHRLSFRDSKISQTRQEKEMPKPVYIDQF